MNDANQSLGRRRGFTLVELLMTIGIILVLIGILVPVLSMARGHAQEVRCLSNQRSLIQAMLSYAADNSGYLPPPNWDGGVNPLLSSPPGTPLPCGWLYNPNKLVASHTFQQTDSTTGVLYQYLTNLDVYRCNADDGNWASNTVQVVTSYMMNGAVCDYGNGGLPEKLRAFKSRSILLWEIPVDLQNDTGLVNDGADYPAEGVTTRHSNGSTVGFIDGHAELMTWTQFTNEWFTNAPGMLWCAPHSSGNDGGKSTYIANTGSFPTSPPPQPANSG